jgi:FtsH-binding integral membrane protein
MGVSYRPMTGAVTVRTGVERATLVRRTYLLVLASVLVTMFGVSFALSTPAVLQWSALHPFLTMIGMFVPLLGAMRFRQSSRPTSGSSFSSRSWKGSSSRPSST